MTTKTLPALYKADVGEGEAGTFEALVATYDVDSVGDKIAPGAFKETLAQWKASGNPIPVLWSHMSHDPDMHIGEVLEAEERKDGLWVHAQLDLEHPKAVQVHRLLKGRRVTQFSFAYDILEAAPIKADGRDVLELQKLHLYEVGPTLVGANQATRLLDAKALGDILTEVKAGRVLSRKNEDMLRSAHTSIGDVLAALDKPSDDDDGKAKDPPAKDEDPSGGKSEEPRMSPATIRLLAELDQLGLL